MLLIMMRRVFVWWILIGRCPLRFLHAKRCELSEVLLGVLTDQISHKCLVFELFNHKNNLFCLKFEPRQLLNSSSLLWLVVQNTDQNKQNCFDEFNKQMFLIVWNVFWELFDRSFHCSKCLNCSKWFIQSIPQMFSQNSAVFGQQKVRKRSDFDLSAAFNLHFSMVRLF